MKKKWVFLIFYKTLSDEKLYNECLLFQFQQLFLFYFFFKSIVRFIDVQDYECNENDKQTKDHLRIASMSLTNSLVNRGPGEVPSFNSFDYKSLIYSF